MSHIWEEKRYMLNNFGSMIEVVPEEEMESILEKMEETDNPDVYYLSPYWYAPPICSWLNEDVQDKKIRAVADRNSKMLVRCSSKKLAEGFLAGYCARCELKKCVCSIEGWEDEMEYSRRLKEEHDKRHKVENEI